MTEEEARHRLLRELGLRPDAFVVALMAVKPYGWIYSYNTRADAEDGDESAQVLGAGPVIVPNDGGAPIELGSRLPPEQAVAEFERERGFLPPLVGVRVLGWQDPRARRQVTLIKTIVSVLGWDLRRAKSVVDEVARRREPS